MQGGGSTLPPQILHSPLQMAKLTLRQAAPSVLPPHLHQTPQTHRPLLLLSGETAVTLDP